MRIAVPLINGQLSSHFGQCDCFRIVDTDETKRIVRTEDAVPPQHEPGVIPRWLKHLQTDVVITRGMGNRAIEHFRAYQVDVVTGAPVKPWEDLVKEYLEGSLEYEENICTH